MNLYWDTHLCFDVFSKSLNKTKTKKKKNLALKHKNLTSGFFYISPKKNL